MINRLIRAQQGLVGRAWRRCTTKTGSVALALPLAFGLCGSGAAQDSATGDVDPAKRMLYTEDLGHYSDKDVGYGAETSFLTWHGYLNFEFDKQQGANSNFDNRELYLSAKSYLSDRVRFTAEFEFEHTPEKLILPIQAYADYKFSDAFTFRAGQFFTPIGISRSFNLRGNRNRMIRQVAVTHDIAFENWSLIGVNLLGQLKNGFFYDVAIANGHTSAIAPGDSFFDAVDTLQDHTEDNNNNKAVHARAGYQSRSFLGGYLNFGVSYATQKLDALEVIPMFHRGVDVRYLHRTGWRFQGEYMIRHGADPPNIPEGLSMDARGWYAQVSKRFVFADDVRYIEPVVQVDGIDPNRHAADNRDLITTGIGFVFSPSQYYLVKFEYDLVSERHGAPLGNNMFWGSIVVEF